MNRSSQQSVNSKREVFSQSLRRQDLSQKLQSKRLIHGMSHAEIVIKVKYLVDGLTNRLDNPHVSQLDIKVSLNQLIELGYLLDEAKSKFIMMSEDDMSKISMFHEMVVQENSQQNQTPILVLVYYSENIISQINPHYMRTVGVVDILKLFTDHEYKELSRDFLIRNVSNSKLWCSALKKQGFNLNEDKELLDALTQLLDKEYAWELLNMQQKIPFSQDICIWAWKGLEMPEVRKFVLAQILTQDSYYEGFLKCGIHDALRVFLDQNWCANSNAELEIEEILKCLKLILIIEPKENLIQGLLESNVLEQLANIRINLFNGTSLILLCEIFNKIDQPILRKYSLIDYSWYQKFFEILIYQKESQLVVDHAFEKIKVLLSSRKFDNQAHWNIYKIMHDYEDKKKKNQDIE